jgi:demethylmenaquinone methyltransferase/2-methoxy-6-polyprenyl-1,4-benzoquinol methylase
MISRKNPWYDSQERQQQLEAYVSRAGAARFGFTLYRETEKVDRVRRHFDTIAAYYDKMNTILSFGMHYLWKRVAVATLDIRPGDCVLDVCGGTGDMAKMSAEKTGAEGMSIVYDINWRMIEEGRTKGKKLCRFP